LTPFKGVLGGEQALITQGARKGRWKMGAASQIKVIILVKEAVQRKLKRTQDINERKR